MIIPREYIKEACDTVRADGGTIVFTNGCFDTCTRVISVI